MESGKKGGEIHMAEFDRQAMDDAATEAENDLVNIPDEHLTIVANWWEKWFRRTPDGKPGAGHKRLGRILREYRTGAKK